jgi:TIR domain
MAQPVKLYICYAPEDKTALSNLEKCLRPLERSGKIQFWHRGKILPGDNHDQQIVAQLDQAQAIIMLVSANLFTPEYYDSTEMTYVFQRHQEAKARVIPVIVEHCVWQQPPLGELSPLPAGGKPARDDKKAWTAVATEINNLAKHIQAEQEPEPSASSTTTRGKTRKSVRTKAQSPSGTALTVKSSTTAYTPHSTGNSTPPQPALLDPEQIFGEEPQPTTHEAKTDTLAYDQRYGKLQDEINKITFRIGIWEPALPFQGIVAEERRAIYHVLKNEKHLCWLGKDLQVPPGVSLQNRVVHEARDADLTILLVESPAIGEMHEFCDHEELLGKTRIFYPEELRSAPEDWGLDIRVSSYGLLSYYQEIDILDCKVRTKVLEWVMKRRSLRYSIQSRSGR